MSRTGFCPNCLTSEGHAGSSCPNCSAELLPLFDASGALTSEFLTARGSCCDSGCRNCPYQDATDSSVSNSTAKVCEACGAKFNCGGPDCWCDSIALTAEKLKNLRQTYRDCLCQNCLSLIAAKRG